MTDQQLMFDIYACSFLALCVALVALVSAADTAVNALGTLKAKTLYEASESKPAHLKLWIDHPDRVMTTIITLNTLLIALCASVSAVIARNHTESLEAAFASTVLVTIVILTFGKLIPKSWARAKADQIAPAALWIMRWFQLVLYPVILGLSKVAERLTIHFGGGKIGSSAITEEELEMLVEESEKAGVIEETKKEMIEGVFDFDETRVREIMTPRTDIVAVEAETSVLEALKLTNETGHSRFPVYSDKLDNVVGIVLVKDLIKFMGPHPGQNVPRIDRMMRKPFFVPESKLISDVFKDLKRTKNHMAVVIDEYGGTAGIVTMEDILEEIVGDIQDEYDAEESNIVEKETGIFDIAGSTNFDEFTEFFELDKTQIANSEELNADTIAGYMTQVLGDLPEVGQTLRIGPLNVEVARVDRHRIQLVRASRVLTEGEEEAGA